MIGKQNLFVALNLAIFGGLAIGIAVRGIEGQIWTLALALLGFCLNAALALLSFIGEKADDNQRKKRLMEELRQEAEERKDRRNAERN